MRVLTMVRTEKTNNENDTMYYVVRNRKTGQINVASTVACNAACAFVLVLLAWIADTLHCEPWQVGLSAAILFFGSMTIWAFWPSAQNKKEKMYRERLKMYRERLEILRKQQETEAEQRLTEQVNKLNLI
jgi:hypothetical protein